jgi:hypothetical protein
MSLVLLVSGLALLVFGALLLWAAITRRAESMYCRACNLYTRRRRCPLCLRKIQKRPV